MSDRFRHKSNRMMYLTGTRFYKYLQFENILFIFDIFFLKIFDLTDLLALLHIFNLQIRFSSSTTIR